MRLWIIALTALAILAFTPDASQAQKTGAPNPAASSPGSTG
jgi:hypothetical protein